MDSTSTSSSPLALYVLDLADYGWGRVDLPLPAGFDPRDVLTGMRAIGPSISGEFSPSGRIGDLVGTSWAALFVATDKFVSTLTEARCTGWDVAPVQLRGLAETNMLSLLQVHGRCGPIVSPGVGRYLASSTLDGSDIFVPENESTILLTARCAKALEQRNLRNVEVSPAGVEALTD